ncbi:MAG: DNA helicase RecQ [Elusimicrobiota bacterium]
MKNRIVEILAKYWGYDSFRPFQEESILSILAEQDSLTVLPTGGGKSVCFQVPALISEGMAVVISPLISLMKDQVDYLKDIGINAEGLNSSLLSSVQKTVIDKIRSGSLKLLYVSPERLMIPSLQELFKTVRVSFFVVDEAHCISHWGHDFRAEYRKLNLLKAEFPRVKIHAFTATATGEVREDIISQLKLDSPRLYVGDIDRANLTYRVRPRSGNLIGQLVNIIEKYRQEPGIIYCLRRSDVDEISAKLNQKGYENLPYHAGMSDKERKKNQEEFSSEKISIIVATIAFGMGIDRSNIRYVIHAAMPKSVEHYQQETGRAGRDGLPSDCYMFYSWSDFRTWEYLFKDSPQKGVMLEKLRALYDFCAHPQCRHKFLVSYFGQSYGKNNCAGCDFCLGEVEVIDNPLIVAQKILSCVYRVKEKFGGDHVADVLKGNITDKITSWGHDQLSTFSLMSSETKAFIRFMIEQLVGQGYLARDEEYGSLGISPSGRQVLRGELIPALAKPIVGAVKKKIEKIHKIKRRQDWAGVDENLFDLLRAKRAELAYEKRVPAYIIFSDKTLRDLAVKKPTSLAQCSQVFGVGEVKLAHYGQIFINVVKEFLSLCAN